MKLPMLPVPLEMARLEGTPCLTAESRVVFDPPNAANAAWLRAWLAGWPGGAGEAAPITLALDPALARLGPEGYQLRVEREGVLAVAAKPAGVFYALQSLRQLLFAPPQGGSAARGEAAGVFIEDRPRFAHRGFMLDEGRHFHGSQTVKALLDQLALLKLNAFHWHLTEDQGWRFAVPGLERLVEIGAVRPGTSRSLLDVLRDRHDGRAHSGFYTGAEIQSIVAYAAERHITIIPEIDLPGHSSAALAAYPELGCRGGPYQVATRFGIFKDILCAGQETTFHFLAQVFDEVARLFPGELVHIGGDEAPKTRWRACPHCQARMTALGLRDARGRPDPHALQTWFTNRLAVLLAERGKRAITWNDALDPALDPSIVVQHWVGKQARSLAAARAGRKLIVSDYWSYYLDHSYALTPLSRTYAFDPVYPGLEAGQVHGVEAPLWSEWVPARARLDYQVWPRLAAVAESGWSEPERKDFASFKRRLRPWLPPGAAPEADWEPGWLAQRLGALTILQAQTRTAGGTKT